MSKPLEIGIFDFNPSRMSEQEAEHIPVELQPFVADKRQYPFNIAQHFPEGVSWLRAENPWFYKYLVSSEEHLAQIQQADTLVLSGSGMSAFYYQEGNTQRFKPQDIDALARTQEILREHVAAGKWILGICFGGQLAVHAVGGKIGRLPTREDGNTVTEAGWLSHELTRAGKKDMIFRGLPAIFYAPHLHNDFVAELPRVGTKVTTSTGEVEVVRAEVLAERYGYLDTDGLINETAPYIQASVTELANGARIYQIQPHPEMATLTKANFLIRQNHWVAKEMGEEYYQQALQIPQDANFSVSQVIPRFVETAREHYERTRNITFLRSTIAQNLEKFIPYLLS